MRCAAVVLVVTAACGSIKPDRVAMVPAPTTVPPIARFDTVADGVFRGAQPNADQFAELQRRYGVKTVIKLNHDIEGEDHVPAGMSVIDDRLEALVVPDEARVDKILDDIDRAPRPVYIHCTHGEDRTGVVVALWKLRHGAALDVAERDMIAHGFHPWHGVLGAWERARAAHGASAKMTP